MIIIDKILWSIAIVLIITNGIYFSIKLKFPQIRLAKMIKVLKEKETEKDITPKDTLIMSLASKIGIGSLAGIALAIYTGGIGSIFWIWVISFLTSINCYCENILGTKYKEKTINGYQGGPSYYIKKGLNNKTLAIIYSLIAIFTYIFCFMTIQNNTIVFLLNDMFKFKKEIISIIIVIITLLSVTKGIKTISKVCNKLVPIMGLLYISIGIFVIIINIKNIPIIFLNIIKAAITKTAIKGGLIYTFIIGVKRSIFGSEAGTGTSAMITSTTASNNYEKQGYIGIISTYFISLIISTITAVIILSSDYSKLLFTNFNGIELTKYAFNYHLGNLGEILLLIILILFGFSTIITTFYYGINNFNNINKSKKINLIFKVMTFIVLFISGITTSKLIWGLVDISTALLTIINIYSIKRLKNDIIE